MKSFIKKLGTTLAVVVALVLSFSFIATPPVAMAADPAQGNCDTSNINSSGLTGLFGNQSECNIRGNGQRSDLFGSGGVVTTIINVMLFVIGILCVIMIIYGGIRYTISRGEDKEISNAKNTILYAVIGLVVAIVAYALVNWVFTSIGQQS